MTRAVAYLRISTRGQEEGFGLDAQRAIVTEYAEANGIELAEIIEETGSGRVSDDEIFSYEHRPKLLGLRERAASGDFDMLIVPKYDRLSRDPTTTAVLKRYFRKHGVQLVSVAEHEHANGNGDTAIGRLIEGILENVADFEASLIAERTGAGKIQARKQGHHEGRIPYGYKATVAGKLEPDEDEAKAVRRIFEYAAKGATPGEITRHMGGTPAPSGGVRWARQTVREMLRNPIYVGETRGIRDTHPAIVSRRRFNQVQAALDARKRSSA